MSKTFYEHLREKDTTDEEISAAEDSPSCSTVTSIVIPPEHIQMPIETAILTDKQVTSRNNPKF